MRARFVWVLAVAAALTNHIDEPAAGADVAGGGAALNAGAGRFKPGGPFELVSHSGRLVTEKDFLGRFVLMSFGYTFCPDVCPTTLGDVSAVLDELGDQANLVTPVFVSVDPARDTPEVLAEYVGYFHPSYIGLTGTPEQIAAIAGSYRVTYEAQAPTGDDGAGYTVDHSAFTYLIGPDGRFQTLFAYGTSPERMARRIRREINMTALTQ